MNSKFQIQKNTVSNKDEEDVKEIRPSIFDLFAEQWKLLVLLVILCVLYFVSLMNIGNIFDEDTFTPIFVMTIFSSLIIALMVVIGERVYEKKSISSYLNDELLSFEARFATKLETILETRFKYGLKQIHGKIDDGVIIRRLHNKNIYWMNTKFNELEASQDNIQEALKNGANVNLLLMRDDNPSGELRGRDSCEFPNDLDHLETSTKVYVEALKTNQKILLSFYKVMKQQKEEDKTSTRGEFKLRFYRDLPSIPILIVESGERHEEVYTGFYLNKFSSGMPYIEWGSADEAFLDNVYNYFTQKWEFAEDGDAEKLLENPPKRNQKTS